MFSLIEDRRLTLYDRDPVSEEVSHGPDCLVRTRHAVLRVPTLSLRKWARRAGRNWHPRADLSAVRGLPRNLDRANVPGLEFSDGVIGRRAFVPPLAVTDVRVLNEVLDLPQKSQFPRTGLVCVSCRQPIALVQYTSTSGSHMRCPACDHWWTTEHAPSPDLMSEVGQSTRGPRGSRPPR